MCVSGGPSEPRHDYTLTGLPTILLVARGCFAVAKRSQVKRLKAGTAVTKQKQARARKRATIENEFADGGSAQGPRPKKKRKLKKR